MGKLLGTEVQSVFHRTELSQMPFTTYFRKFNNKNKSTLSIVKCCIYVNLPTLLVILIQSLKKKKNSPSGNWKLRSTWLWQGVNEMMLPARNQKLQSTVKILLKDRQGLLYQCLALQYVFLDLFVSSNFCLMSLLSLVALCR